MGYVVPPNGFCGFFNAATGVVSELIDGEVGIVFHITGYFPDQNLPQVASLSLGEKDKASQYLFLWVEN